MGCRSKHYADRVTTRASRRHDGPHGIRNGPGHANDMDCALRMIRRCRRGGAQLLTPSARTTPTTMSTSSPRARCHLIERIPRTARVRADGTLVGGSWLAFAPGTGSVNGGWAMKGLWLTV
jgi:hypothetical protein